MPTPTLLPQPPRSTPSSTTTIRTTTNTHGLTSQTLPKSIFSTTQDMWRWTTVRVLRLTEKSCTPVRSEMGNTTLIPQSERERITVCDKCSWCLSPNETSSQLVELNIGPCILVLRRTTRLTFSQKCVATMEPTPNRLSSRLIETTPRVLGWNKSVHQTIESKVPTRSKEW